MASVAVLDRCVGIEHAKLGSRRFSAKASSAVGLIT